MTDVEQIASLQRENEQLRRERDTFENAWSSTANREVALQSRLAKAEAALKMARYALAYFPSLGFIMEIKAIDAALAAPTSGEEVKE